MNKTVVFLIASLFIGESALAAERVAPPAPSCISLEKLKSDYADKTRVTTLTIGQFHFVEGMYVASPFTPHGLPPGDGAIMVESGGHAGIIWTRGKQACITVIAVDEHHAGYAPMPVDAKMIEAVKTGKDEAVAPAEDTSKDVHL